MNTCRTCKYWDNYTCDRLELESGRYNPSPKEAGLYVYVSDDSGLQCELRSGPDFGCTLWVEKV
jgi:hypothetical protein